METKKRLVDNIHTSLRNGRLSDALNELYVLCKEYSKTHLNEVVSQITKINLVNSNDRAGTIKFEDKLRFQAQVSSSIIQLLTIIDDSNGQNSVIQNDSFQLNLEKEKRSEAEKRISILEKAIEVNSSTRSKSIVVREKIKLVKIECDIIAISRSETEGKYDLVFKESSGERKLKFAIGKPEAQSIVWGMQKIQFQRPLTYDMVKNLINDFGYVLKEMVIDKVVNDGTHGLIFFSKLIFSNKENYIEIDSRVSDALSLTVRYLSPIFISKSILDDFGIIEESD